MKIEKRSFTWFLQNFLLKSAGVALAQSSAEFSQNIELLLVIGLLQYLGKILVLGPNKFLMLESFKGQ